MSSLSAVIDSHCIETELNDILTLNSCTTLISELIKFILYRKQQLPYTFDRLKYLITEGKSKEIQKPVSKINSISIERQFKLAEDRLTTLELIFTKTKEELAKSIGGFITEVALLFGNTPMTPKQVYRIHLPQICFSHSSFNHPERKHLIQLLHSVILSNNLCNMLREPMNLTNMFVFIKKNFKSRQRCREEGNINEWFIPKNRYEIPQTGQHFHIKFRHPNPHQTNCSCPDFIIYSDENETLLNLYENDESETSPIDTTWYQAGAIFQGFKDVYIEGVSVANFWF